MGSDDEVESALAALRAADPVLGALIDSVGTAAIADPRRGYPRIITARWCERS